MRIDGAGALVTGGASGLGRAVAQVLSSRGARVVILDVPSSQGEAVAAELGGGAMFVAGDVRSEEDASRAVGAATDLRIVVNCAGVGGPGRIVRRSGPLPLDDFRRIIDINLVGTFNVMRLGAARMAAADPIDGERGVIVNTSSTRPSRARSARSRTPRRRRGWRG